MTEPKATKKDSARWGRLRVRHLVTIIVAVAVICGASYGILLYHTNASTKAPVAAANDFLNSIETNSDADAYLQLCPATKKQFTEAQFAAYVKAQPELESHSNRSVELSTVGGVQSAIVVENVKNASGDDQTRSIVLNKVGSDWMVCGQPY